MEVASDGVVSSLTSTGVKGLEADPRGPPPTIPEHQISCPVTLAEVGEPLAGTLKPLHGLSGEPVPISAAGLQGE